jgi:peptidyl-prolyl cis-trans isomerase C
MQLCCRWINPLFIAAAIVCLFIGPAWADQATTTNKEVASVNGKPIFKSRYERELSGYLERVAKKGRKLSDADLSSVKKRILENLITTEVLYQECQKQGIKVGDQIVSEEIEKVKKRFPDEAAYKNALKGMNVSEKEIRAQIQIGMAITQLFDTNVRQKIMVTKEESEKYYKDHPNMFMRPERVKASHILIKVAPDAEASQKKQARKKIETLQKKVRKGEDFGLLAKANSEGPSAQHGGDLGYFSRGQMVKPFENAAFGLKVGEVSEIVETQFGFHLIKLTDKQPAENVPYKDIRPRLEQLLKKEKEKAKIQNYIEELKKTAKIERFM